MRRFIEKQCMPTDVQVSTEVTAYERQKPAAGRFGILLRRLRMEAGFTLRGFAGQVGVSPGYLSRVETGREASPTAIRIRRMSALLGIDPDMLFSAAGKVDPDLVRYICAVPAMTEFLRFALRKGFAGDELESMMAE